MGIGQAGVGHLASSKVYLFVNLFENLVRDVVRHLFC